MSHVVNSPREQGARAAVTEPVGSTSINLARVLGHTRSRHPMASRCRHCLCSSRSHTLSRPLSSPASAPRPSSSSASIGWPHPSRTRFGRISRPGASFTPRRRLHCRAPKISKPYITISISTQELPRQWALFADLHAQIVSLGDTWVARSTSKRTTVQTP